MSSVLGKRVTSSVPLVGRAQDLERLVEAVTAPPAVVLIEGEAGIGKTRLVTELAARPDLDGRRFAVGSCRRIREPFPLGPVIEAVRRLGDELAEATLSPVCGALRPLLPEVAHLMPPAPDALDDRAAERHRVFRGLAEVLDALGPAVLALEDLHWADEQTVEFVGYLLADPPDKLALVLTFRGEEVNAGVRALVARLPMSTTRGHILLAPFDERETGRLAAAILGVEQVSGEFAAHLCGRTSGLPFAIEELLALLRERGRLVRRGDGWVRAALEELGVPDSIRDSVLERVGRLSDKARSMVEAAAVLQIPASVPALAKVGGAELGWAARGTAEAIRAGLFAEIGEAVGFRHVLAAQAVYDDMPGPRRRELHDRAAVAVETLDPVPLGQVAYHLRHAGRLEEWAVAAERAADLAVEAGDDAEAVRVLEGVLRHAPLEDEQRGRLALKLVRAALETLDAAQRVAALLTEALECDLPRAVRGELRFRLGLLLDQAGGDPARQRQLYAEAVEELDDRPDLMAWAMVGLGLPMVAGVPLAEHKRWLRRALELLPVIGDPVFEVFLLGKMAMVLVWIGDPAWRGLADRIIDQTGGIPRHRREVKAYHAVGVEACYVGHHETADRFLTAGLQGAQACESRQLELRFRAALALLDYCRGSWHGLGDTVDVLLDEVADFAPARLDVAVVAGCLDLAHGDVDAAERRLFNVVETVEGLGEFEHLPLVGAALARLAVARAASDDAVAGARRFLLASESKGLWAPGVRALPAITEALATAGHLHEASTLVTRYDRELRDLDAPLAPAALNHARGVLEAAAKRWSAAARHYLTAAERYERLLCPYEAAQAKEQGAVSLVAAGDGQAEGPLRAALGAYQRLGATWDLARVARIARRWGLSIPTGRRGGQRGYGSDLSPRERHVAELAARGMTNKEIAQRLFVSPNTVDKHVMAVLRKLGLHSRRALAHHLPDVRPGD